MTRFSNEEEFDVNLETLDDFYNSCDSETSFDHKEWHYEILWGEENGWDMWFSTEKTYLDSIKGSVWQTVAEKEHFENLCDMVFNFILKNDGRTIAEYICDYQKIPRYVVPIPPKFVNDKKRKQ